MAARPLPKTDTTQVITINSNGTWSGPVSLNPGDTVRFDVTYPSGSNQCVVVFEKIRWSNQRAEDPGGPIIIGSAT